MDNEAFMEIVRRLAYLQYRIERVQFVLSPEQYAQLEVNATRRAFGIPLLAEDLGLFDSNLGMGG